MMNIRVQLQLLFLKKYNIYSAFADACGNTFLIFDCLHTEWAHDTWEKIKKEIWICLPHANVDDALVLRKFKIKGNSFEVKMHVLEPDGTEADFCGNGARAIGAFLSRVHCQKFYTFSLSSRRGKHLFKYIKGECFVDMGQPIVMRDKKVFVYDGLHYRMEFIDSVEPHLVTDDFFDFDLLAKMGKQINDEWKEKYPQGVNVNCFRKLREDAIEVMTYERGLYRITAACGTGSVACCASAIDRQIIQSPREYCVITLGGMLHVHLEAGRFWLGGPLILSTDDLNASMD